MEERCDLNLKKTFHMMDREIENLGLLLLVGFFDIKEIRKSFILKTMGWFGVGDSLKGTRIYSRD